MNKNHIIDNRIYHIEIPDGRKDKYSVNTILILCLETIHSDGWETGLLSENVSFHSEPIVAIKNGNIGEVKWHA